MQIQAKTVIHLIPTKEIGLYILKEFANGNGFVEQSVVRLVSNEEVRGSKPRRSTFAILFVIAI